MFCFSKTIMSEVDMDGEQGNEKRVLARFKSETGDVVGNLLDLPLYVNVEHLTLICNSLLQQVKTYLLLDPCPSLAYHLLSTIFFIVNYRLNPQF